MDILRRYASFFTFLSRKCNIKWRSFCNLYKQGILKKKLHKKPFHTTTTFFVFSFFLYSFNQFFLLVVIKEMKRWKRCWEVQDRGDSCMRSSIFMLFKESKHFRVQLPRRNITNILWRYLLLVEYGLLFRLVVSVHDEEIYTHINFYTLFVALVLRRIWNSRLLLKC